MARPEQYDTTTWRCSIDLAELRSLKQAAGAITWIDGAGPYASAQWWLSLASLTVAFRYGDAAPHVEKICLGSTATPFGGRRAWLCCPGCARNVRVLYVGRAGYRCRHCYSLRYPSQRRQSHHTAVDMAERARMKLGGEPDISRSFPNKPRGMRSATYLRLLERDRQLVARWTAGLLRSYGKLGVNFGE